jgi:hypothetical protein
MFRGSRKHVLDWTSRPEFCVELLQLVRPVDCRVTAESKWMPRGYRSPDEARLETFGPEVLPSPESWANLRRWWLVHERGANTPNWDIAAGCEIDGKTGLILVEAKANVPELSALGKTLDLSASKASVENHERIAAAIAEACSALRQLGASMAISRDSHYQLSNRVAFAWKLAMLGIPTVLVYLGFLGDDGIADAGAPFSGSAHWETVFGRYASSAVPGSIFEQRIECGSAPVWFLVRSRRVIEMSPSRPTNTPQHGVESDASSESR